VKKPDPLKEGDALLQAHCPACDQPFLVGQSTIAVALGPGDNVEAQWNCRTGKPYAAVLSIIHWTCSEDCYL